MQATYALGNVVSCSPLHIPQINFYCLLRDMDIGMFGGNLNLKNFKECYIIEEPFDLYNLYFSSAFVS